MSYSWAILIIVIVAGTLYSLGIFTPQNSAGTGITGFSDVKVLSAVILSNEIELQIANEAPNPIVINAINVSENNQLFTNFKCESSSLSIGDNTLCAVYGTFPSPRAATSINIGYTTTGVFETSYISSGSVSANIAPLLLNNQLPSPTNIAYVGSWFGTLTEINTTSNTVIASWGNQLWGQGDIFYSANGSLAYIVDGWTTMGIYKTPGLQLVRKYWINGCNHYGTLSQNGEYLFNTVDCANYIDVTNLSETSSLFDFKTITVGNDPEKITNINGILYVLNRASNSISLVGDSNFTNFATISNIGILNSAEYDMAYDSANKNLYIADYNVDNNNLSIINTTSRSYIGGINSIGLNPWYAALSANGKLMYISDSYSSQGGNYGKLSILNLSNGVVIANVRTGNEPMGVAIDPSTGNIWVLNYNSNSISIINPVSYTVTATITGFNNPEDLIIINGYAYVTNYGGNTVSVVSTSTNSITATISVGSNPFRIAVSPINSSQVYVTNYGSNTVSVINAKTNVATTISNMHNCANPQGIAFTPNGEAAYMACWNNYVEEINATTNLWQAEINSLGEIQGSSWTPIAVSPDGKYVYTGLQYAPGQMDVIATSNNSIVKRIATPVDMSYLLFSSDGSILYALYYWEQSVNLVEYNSNSLNIIGQVGSFYSPYQISISPNNEYLGVSDAASQEASIVNISSGAVYSFSMKWGNTWGVAFSPDSKFAYFSSGAFVVRLSLLNYSLKTIFTGQCAGPLSVSPDGNFLYELLTCGGSAYSVPQSGVVTISLNPFEVVNYTYPVGMTINGLATTPDGSRLLISNHDGTAFSVMNTLTGHIIYSTLEPFPPQNSWDVVDNGNIAYVAMEDSDYGTLNSSGGISIINISSGSIIGAINGIGEYTTSLAISPDGQTLYSLSRFPMGTDNSSYSAEINVISTVTDSITNHIKVPGCPLAMRLMPNGNTLVYPDPCSNKVFFLSLQNDSIYARIPVACGAQNIGVTPNGNFLVVSDACGYASIINVSSMTDIYDISGLNNPQDVFISSGGKEAYFADWNDNLVHVLNITKAEQKNANPWITTIPMPAEYLRVIVAGNGAYSDW
jgi:YVTN family beta-propeller protein